MHPDEVALDASLVRRLVARQFPEWEGLPLERVAEVGTDNALFRLGDALVVRLPRRPRTSVTLRKELRWLPRLAPLLPLPIPQPVAQGRPGEGYPFAWAVYRWLRGERAARDRIHDGAAFARDLAGFVAALQGVDPAGAPPPGAHNFFRGAPLAARDAATRAAIAALGLDAATAVWEKALAAPPWDRAPTWVHGDLDAQNLLIVDGALAGVVDFGGLAAGDPACDVMAAWKVLPRDARELFRELLDVDDATWMRSRGWALSQAVVALSYYTLDTHPVLVTEARHWLAEVLAGTAGAARSLPW